MTRQGTRIPALAAQTRDKVWTPAAPAAALEVGWQEHGACNQPDVDPDLFYSQRGERSGRVHEQRELQAKAICHDRCPVIEQCRAYAIAIGERHGVWGGLGEAELRLHARRRLAAKRAAERAAARKPTGPGRVRSS
jgi:WhiB family redox-sensing transcriptional regulator